MRTQYYTATSLDGFLASEDDALDWLFPLGDLIVQVGSVTLGRGMPLFPRRVLHPVLRLVSVQRMGSGMVELRYEVERMPAGAVRCG